MERIKKAIENAKNPELNGNGDTEQVNQSGQTKKSPRSPRSHQDLKNTIKLTIAILLIFAGGWLWLKLDFMNKLELIASEYINDTMKLVRAEARKRTADEEKFKQILVSNLDQCQSAAAYSKENYIKLVQDVVRDRNKNDTQDKKEAFVIAQSAEKKAESIFEADKAECLRIYNSQLGSPK
jgi:predicted nucleic acid-binding protein